MLNPFGPQGASEPKLLALTNFSSSLQTLPQRSKLYLKVVFYTDIAIYEV